MHSLKIARWRVVIAVGVVLMLLATACGDDGDDGDDGDGAPTSAGGSPTTEPAEPRSGGSATILLMSETGSLDPARITSSFDMQRASALYGGLVFLDSLTGEIVPVLAESFEPDEDDFASWTLKLKPGITFSDGSAMTAEVVQANWERVANPESKSPSFTSMRTISAMSPIDDLTLSITLEAPNASFDHAVARVGANYIVSGEALANGSDLSGTAYGAGPYLMDEWIRDDRMVLKKNPEWKGSDGPYLDEIVLRPLPDEDQRVDTFVTGQADVFYTSTASSRDRAEAERQGSTSVRVPVPLGTAYVFNTTKPPFDDIRIRTAYAIGVDWQALVETWTGDGSEAPYNFTIEGTPLYTADAALPAYDAAEAQRLVNDYLADTGSEQLTISHLAFQSSTDQLRVKFIQAALNQLDNVNVEIDTADSPTTQGKVLNGNYMVSSWGFPALDPDPGLFTAVYSSSGQNYAKYNNADVDRWLDEGRASNDDAVRTPLYKQVLVQLAEDIPFYPYALTVNNFVSAPDVHGATMFNDAVLRYDLLWKSD